MSAILAAIAATYRKVADHATKLLGLVGLAVSGALDATNAIDPDSVMAAAIRYLHDEHWIARIGAALFGLVILRGWWTGIQVKKLKAAATPPPETPK
jgi:hypothetical protein